MADSRSDAGKCKLAYGELMRATSAELLSRLAEERQKVTSRQTDFSARLAEALKFTPGQQMALRAGELRESRIGDPASQGSVGVSKLTFSTMGLRSFADEDDEEDDELSDSEEEEEEEEESDSDDEASDEGKKHVDEFVGLEELFGWNSRFAAMISSQLNINRAVLFEFRNKNLSSFAFGEPNSNKVTKWSFNELVAILNRYEHFNGFDEQVRLYESCANEEFRASPPVIVTYAKALLKTGSASQCEAVLRKLIAEHPKTAAAWKLIGDANKMKYGAASEGASLHLIMDLNKKDEIKHAEYERVLISVEETYAKCFGEKAPSDVGKLWLCADRCLKEAIKAYEEYFRLSCRFEPLVKICVLLKTRHVNLKQRLYALSLRSGSLSSAEQAEETSVRAESVRTNEEVKRLCQLAFVCMLRDGGYETAAVSVPSAMLEVVCFDPLVHQEKISHLRHLVCANIQSPSDLQELIFRLKYLSRLFRREKHTEEEAVLNNTVSSLERALNKLENRGLKRFKALVQMSAPTTPRDVFLARTFNFRGMIAAPRATYLPGNLQLFGARVPDIIVNQADIEQFEKILRYWDLLEETDTRAFLTGLIKHIRSCFGTHKLQDLQSDYHAEFDAHSDGMIELVGIPKAKRQGTETVTNASVALLFVGDCREHAFEMLAFFSFWQNYHMDKILVRIFQHIMHPEPKENVSEAVEPLFAQVRNHLYCQLRGAQVGIFAQVQMNDRYSFAHYKDGDESWLPHLEVYGLDEYRAKKPLSAYQQWSAFFLVEYEDGSVKRIGPSIPHKDGVPLPLPNEEKLVKLTLLNDVENHCMTFLFNEKDDKIEMMDSFYNEHFNKDHERSCEKSPYTFGQGNTFDLKQLETCGTLNGGFMTVQGQDGKPVQIPVHLVLLPYSERVERLALSETGLSLKYIGMELTDLDVAECLRLENEHRAQGKLSQRDLFLSSLHQWIKHKGEQ